MVIELSFLQVFQLTAFIIRGPVTSSEKFNISLDRVMIGEDEVRGALLCAQYFLRSPHFNQRNLFSESGIAILAESAAICDSITSSVVFEPWSQVKTTSSSQLVADVCAGVNRPVDRRRAVKVSQENWYAVCGDRLS